MGNFGWSYPPGVSESMIPGCSKEDQVYEDIQDQVDSMSDLEIVEKLESCLGVFQFEKLMAPLRDALVDWLVNNPPDPPEPEDDR